MDAIIKAFRLTKTVTLSIPLDLSCKMKTVNTIRAIGVNSGCNIQVIKRIIFKQNKET